MIAPSSTPAGAQRLATVGRLQYHGAAVAFFVLLTVLLAFPVAAGLLSNRIPGWEGDNLYYVRSLWWWKRALLDLRISPFVDTTAYYPTGHSIAYSEMTAANTLLFLPVTALAGPVVAYNVVLLFSFVATGVGTYLWVHHLTGSRPAGLLAGTVVAFLPFRFSHLPGHLPQMTTQWIPLTLFAFERFIDRRTVGRAAWVGAGVALTCLGCWYYGYALALVFPVYAVIRTLDDRAVWRDPWWWTGIAVSAAVALLLTAPFLYQMLKVSSGMRRELADLQSWALNFYDPFIPNLAHPLWGELMRAWFPRQWAAWPEKIHALGYAALLAGVVGLLQWRRRRRSVILALAAVWLLSYSIALGPFLKAGDELVRIPAPEWIARLGAVLAGDASRPAQSLADSFVRDGVVVPLPSAFLYKLVPVTSSMRVMARFTIWTGIATAALAGFGLVTIMTWSERQWGAPARGAVAAGLIAFVALESLSHIPTMAVGPRAVDLWLADQPDDVLIVELPLQQGTRSFQNYWATEHGRRSVLGWSGDSFAPPVLIQRTVVLKDFPDAKSVAFLKTIGTTYVLVTPSQIADWVTMERRLAAEPLLQRVKAFNDVHVYKVNR